MIQPEIRFDSLSAFQIILIRLLNLHNDQLDNRSKAMQTWYFYYTEKSIITEKCHILSSRNQQQLLNQISNPFCMFSTHQLCLFNVTSLCATVFSYSKRIILLEFFLYFITFFTDFKRKTDGIFHFIADDQIQLKRLHLKLGVYAGVALRERLWLNTIV